MKMKTAYSFVVFITTFLIASAIFSIYNFDFFNSEINEENGVKIYNFLKKDKEILREMSKAMRENDYKLENKIRNWEIIQTYFKIRAKQDVSQLPRDFSYAWERSINNSLEWMEFANNLREKKGKASIESQAEEDISEEKIAEGERLTKNMISVAQKYGIKFDENNNLIEEN